MLKGRVIGEGTFLGNRSLANVERPLIVAGQVQRLGRKGEIDPFGIEALHDLGVDPGGVIQIVPIIGRVVPVDNQDVQGVGVKFVE